MNALKILNRGHQNLLDVIKDLPSQAWTDGFVTGSWTVRDVVDHIAIYEEMQVEAFEKFINPNALTPLHDEKAQGTFLEFNAQQSEKDKDKTGSEVFKRYTDGFTKLEQIVKNFSAEQMVNPEATIWYGDKCSFDDVIAYNFGHKKHHLAQIKLFRQRNKV